MDEPVRDDVLARFLPENAPVEVRQHVVTAIVVNADGGQTLPRTLAALAAQERAPEHLIGVDVGSRDGSQRHLLDVVDIMVGAQWAAGPGGALNAGVGADPLPDDADLPDGVPPDGVPATVRWYWVLHDDSAAQPGALAALLDAADRHPRATVLVPKTVGWTDPTLLVGVGVLWAPGNPVVDLLDAHERDQGQHDQERPVHAGDTAGMLVRADAWQDLGGIVPLMGPWAGPVDLCRRAWAAGGEVVAVPGAVVAHQRAAARGACLGGRAGLSRRTVRAGHLLLELTQAPRRAVAWRWVRGWVTTLLRAIALLLSRGPRAATAELAGGWDVLGHPGRLRAARRSVRRPPTPDLARPPEARAAHGAVLGHALDTAAATVRTARSGPGRWRPSGPDAGALAIAVALLLASLVRHSDQLFGSGDLQGGGLLPPAGAANLFRDYEASWHDVGLGTSAPLPGYLPVLAVLALPLLGHVDLLLRLLIGLSAPLAFASLYLSLGPRAVGGQRTALAVAYACLPAAAAATGAGRISTLAVLLLAPPTARVLRHRHADLVAGRTPRAAPAGVLLGVLAVFAPAVLILVALGLVAQSVRARAAVRWGLVRYGLLVLSIAGLFQILWVPHLLAAPWLLLTDLGRSDPSLGMPAAAVWGLSPGGPTAVAWAGLPLLATALAATFLRPERRVVGTLLAGLLGLAATAWAAPFVEAVWPNVRAGTIWSGQFALMAGALLALVAASEAGRPGSGGSWLRRAWLVSVGVLVVGWWMAPGGVTEVSAQSALPPVVALDAEGPARPRALVLRRYGDDEIRYGIATGPATRLGDADAVSGDPTDGNLTQAVRALVSGAGVDAEAELASRGIRYVVVNADPADPMVAGLDATAGLRRLASDAAQSLWIVAGDPSRASLHAGAGSADAEVTEVPVLTEPTSVDVELHPLITLPRELIVAERADPGWRATLADEPLELGTNAVGMLSAQVGTPGTLVVAHRGWHPFLAGAQLMFLLVICMLALPRRRVADADEDAP